MSAGHPVPPKFTGLATGQQLFDVWDRYYTDEIGSMFPEAVALPIGGVPTEDGQAIFGAHLDRIEGTQREWKVASRLYSIVRERLESDTPLADEGEMVLGLPRPDFTEIQNTMAEEGMVIRGLSAFTDRSGLHFPQHFDASRDLPRYTRVLDDGMVELVQQQDLSALEAAGIATRGAYVAVKRVYGPAHEQYERDVRAVEMVLSPHSQLSDEHQEHPALIDTYRSDSELDMHDDAIVERLNGQRPRTYSWGVVE